MNNFDHAIPKICYVGMISQQRGIVEMINAVEHLNVKLVIAGTFIDSQTEQLVKSLPGWGKVDYGEVSHEDIKLIYAKEMGENGRYAVETHYNWDFESDKLIKLYEGLLGEQV